MGAQHEVNKRGLDYTFIECEGHSYRLADKGSHPIGDTLKLSGGNSWYAQPPNPHPSPPHPSPFSPLPSPISPACVYLRLAGSQALLGP